MPRAEVGHAASTATAVTASCQTVRADRSGRPRHQWTSINRRGSVGPNMTGRMVSFSAIDPRPADLLSAPVRRRAAGQPPPRAAPSLGQTSYFQPTAAAAGRLHILNWCGLFFEPLTGLALTRPAITGDGRRLADAGASRGELSRPPLRTGARAAAIPPRYGHRSEASAARCQGLVVRYQRGGG